MCEVLTLTNSLDVRCWHWSLNSLLESVESWDFPLKGRSVVFNWAFISRFAFLFITLFHYCPSLLALSCCFLLPLILLPFITHLHVDVRQYPVHITCSPLSCFYYFILLWAQYMCSHILLVLATHSHTSHAGKKTTESNALNVQRIRQHASYDLLLFIGNQCSQFPWWRCLKCFFCLCSNTEKDMVRIMWWD